MPDTRPNSKFSDNQNCSACELHLTLSTTNFSRRLEELELLIEKIAPPSPTVSNWQAIVGVSGGKDSTRQALWVRDRLKIEPLLVSISYPSRQISREGVANLENLIERGFSVEQVFVAPQLARKLFRKAFLSFGNAFKATEIVLFASVQQIAVRRGIPLIFWGENVANQIGDQAAEGSSIWDGNRLKYTNTLQGGDISWISDVADTSTLNFYKFPEDGPKSKGLNVVFLGPAWPDWNSSTNSAFSLYRGLNFSEYGSLESGDLHNTEMIDEHFIMVNNLMRYYKFGFGRASEQASQYVRGGKISRQEAKSLAEAYDAAYPEKALTQFLSYVEIDLEQFWELVKNFGNPHLFDFSVRPPRPKFEVGVGLGR